MMDINSLLGLENIKPEDINKIKLQLQEINDTIRGGLRSANLKEYRNTYVINAQDSLDATYPMYVHFNIIPEMVKIVSINISFWFQNFRAYAKSASSGGGSTSGSGGGQTSSSGGAQTSSSGGAQTPTSSSGGGQTSSSGGAQTSSSGGGQTSSSTSTPSGGGSTSGASEAGSNRCWTPVAFVAHADGYLGSTADGYSVCNAAHTHTTPDHTHPGHTHTVDNHTHTVDNHTHTVADHTHTVAVANHTHTVDNHTHTVADHTHSTPNHTHDITYGIYEDSTSPTVMFYVSRDNGLTYSLPVGSYTADHENLDITSMIDTAGGKLIKFTSNARTRLSVQITISLNIKVR